MAVDLEPFVRRLWQTEDVAVTDTPATGGLPLIAVSVRGHALITSPGPGLTRALLSYQGLRLPRARARRVALAGVLPLLRPAPNWWISGPGEPLHRAVARSAGLPGERVLVVPRPDDGHYKPSLMFLDERGGISAFAKLSWHDATDERLAAEAAALRTLGGSVGPGIQAPLLLADTRHGDRPVIVTAPLPSDIRQHPRTLLADQHLRSLAGPVHRVPWSQTALSHDLRNAIGHAQARGDSDRAAILRGGDAWAADRWPRGIESGRVHGDLVPWNLALDRAGTVHVWDWEHFAPVNPFGLDAAHWQVLTGYVNLDLTWEAALDRVARTWVRHAGSSLTGREAAVLCGLELLARSESLRSSDGTEPYPIDDQVTHLVRSVEETP